MGWMTTAPLPLVGLAILALLLVCVEIGFASPRWMRRPTGAKDARPGGPDLLLSAVLGLLALLLGFTFSLALNRFEARRDLVLQEANAIGTTWLRVQLLEEPLRGQMDRAMRDYVRVRIAWSETEERGGGGAATDAAQRRLWTLTGAAVRGDPSPQLSRAVMDAMNQSFDLAAARTTARSTQIPRRILNILMLYAALAAVMLGYVLAADGRRHRMATTLLLALLSLSLILIMDIDRPLRGGIKVSQQPMEALLTTMGQPASGPAPATPPGR